MTNHSQQITRDDGLVRHRAGHAAPARVAAVLAAGIVLLWASGGARAGDPRAELARLEHAFEAVTKQVTPSVVGIRARRRYFARVPATRAADDGATFEQLVLINGSGTIIDASGLILTNEHVIHDAQDISVVFSDKRRTPATVLAADTRSDLAILRVNRRGLHAAQFCDWASVQRGQWAVAVGNPFGLGSDGQLSISVGVISNLGRRLPGLGEADDRLYDDMIQTTAAINPGNSGGPLFDLQGRLVGVVTAMHTRAGGDEGTGFAIPMSPARRAIIDRLMRGQRIDHGTLGLEVSTPSGDAPADGVRGAAIIRVAPDSPAARANLRPGDVILSMSNTHVRDVADLATLVSAAEPGQPITLGLRRASRLIEITIIPDARTPGSCIP